MRFEMFASKRLSLSFMNPFNCQHIGKEVGIFVFYLVDIYGGSL